MKKQNTEAAALIGRLKETALKTGFSEAGVIDTAGLRFYPEIRAICEKNTCRSYNTCWASPPATGTLEECRQRCEQYDFMLLLNCRYDMKNSFDIQTMLESMTRFKKLMEQFDQNIREFLDSYQILSNEGCGRCKSCTWPDAPCRFPDRLYHSIEGYGFQISKLAKAAGIRYHNSQNTITYFGALLFCAP